jgi:hypothetical protein
LNLLGTIVAFNGEDCSTGIDEILSLGHNLDSDATCNLTDPTDLPNTDPMLGPPRSTRRNMMDATVSTKYWASSNMSRSAHPSSASHFLMT